MTRSQSGTQWRDDFLHAFNQGDEARARVLLIQFGASKARPLLEAMLDDPASGVRQAAVFGLGELGGHASTRALERQLTVEQLRRDHDGTAVMEAVTQALGRVKGASTRTQLVRRLKRLVDADRPEPTDVNDLACALWRQRHSELIPVVRQCLEELADDIPTALHGLLILLEKTPDGLRSWASDASVPMELKSEALTLLVEELPDALVMTLPAFVSAALPLVDAAAKDKGPSSVYCTCLFTLILLNPEHLLPSLPEAALAQLRGAAQRLVAATSTRKCALQSAVLLKHLGQPEDAVLIEAHRPADATLAKVFDDAAKALRKRPATEQLD